MGETNNLTNYAGSYSEYIEKKKSDFNRNYGSINDA